MAFGGARPGRARAGTPRSRSEFDHNAGDAGTGNRRSAASKLGEGGDGGFDFVVVWLDTGVRGDPGVADGAAAIDHEAIREIALDGG